MSEKKIAIIVLNWNGKQDTLECLASLKKLTYPLFSIFLADNGSQDDSISSFKTLYPDVILIDNKVNLGFAEGNNKAIQCALDQGFDYLLLLNNDTTVDAQLLEAFLESEKKFPGDIFGGKVHLYSTPDYLDHLGGIWNLSKGEFELIGCRKKASDFCETLSLDYVAGCCLFASKEVFKKVGFLDPRFFLYWEESDFCYRAKQLGIYSKVCPQAKIYHKVSASFTGGKPHSSYFYWRNRFLFAEKNLNPKDLLYAWLLVFIPSIMKLVRHYMLQNMQYFFSKCFHKNKLPNKTDQIKLTKASLVGVKDYVLRRFYNGPSWIFKKNSPV
jgi:GT2 family glycosyltransferase